MYKFHETWAKKYKKVGCITSDAKIICKKLIDLNQNYIIPKFKYESKANNYRKALINPPKKIFFHSLTKNPS